MDFFDCYIICWLGKHPTAADSLSRKPNSEDNEDPPKTQNSLFTLTGEPEHVVTELTQSKHHLPSGFDLKLIERVKYWAK